jgi:pimeloyl-ACP methyl ester carboxylesterase
VARIEEGELTLEGVRVFYRCVPGEGTPTVYCHGNPAHGEEFVPFLERGGPAIAIDMPGWGRSGRPEAFDYSMYGLSAFLERCLSDELGIVRRKLVVHDWGSLTLIGAQRRPELVEKLVIVNAVPLLPGYRWHRIARIWRRRPWGELLNAITSRSGIERSLRQATGDRGPMPPEFVDMIWDRWDAGTGRAVLALYRHADPDRLARAGEDLGRLSCPALVVWGERDPYLPIRAGEAYAAALPNAELDLIPAAGHWPWIDDARLVDRIVGFLE